MYIAAVFIAERARGNEKCDPTIDMATRVLLYLQLQIGLHIIIIRYYIKTSPSKLSRRR